MSEVRPSDILLRVGGRTLLRHGVLALGGPARGRVEEFKETFTRADAATCATYVDQDGILRTASANVVRIEYPPALSGLVDQFGYPYCGPVLEGTRQNLLDNSDYEADIVGSSSYGGSTVVRDNAHAIRGSWALKCTTVLNTFSGIGITTRSGAKPAATPGSVYSASGWVYATGSAIGQAMRVQIDWYNGAAYISTSAGTAVTLVAGWNRLLVTGTAPGSTTGVVVDIITNTAAQPSFDVWVDVPQFELGAFASSAIPTLTVSLTRAADSLTVPFNQGPMDLTILTRLARPVWADASGDIGLFPNVFTFGVRASGSMESSGGKTARTLSIEEWTDNSHSTSVIPAIPAGTSLSYVGQYKNLKTAPQVAEDIGAGLSSFSTATSALASFGSQTLTLGFGGGLYGVLLDLIVMRGLRTLSEALAVP